MSAPRVVLAAAVATGAYAYAEGGLEGEIVMSRLVRSIKEAVRHFLYKAGLSRRDLAYLQPATRRERFAAIYEGRMWQVGETHLPLSGRGSSLTATESIRRELPVLLKPLGMKTLLDVGCGDMTWMGTLDVGDYIGIDIVPSVITQN